MVVGVESFSGNPYDSKPLSVALASIGRIFGKEFSRVLVERVYRVYENVGLNEVILVGRCIGKRGYAGLQDELDCRGRSGLEAVIGHLQWEASVRWHYL